MVCVYNVTGGAAIKSERIHLSACVVILTICALILWKSVKMSPSLMVSILLVMAKTKGIIKLRFKMGLISE